MGAQAETYTLQIKVLSPLHVGSGDRPGTKSRWLADGRVWLVDEAALLAQLSGRPHLLDRFERFCLDPRQSLLAFLKRERIDPEAVSLYSVRHLGVTPNNFYLAHIKQPGKPPRPYLPGSSLKGAVRSALLRAELIGDEVLQREAAHLITGPLHGRTRPSRRHADDALEKRVFGKDQHHEWLRLFQFSDSAPIPLSRLWATEVRILSVQGQDAGVHLEDKKGRGGPVTLHPEVIRPGASFAARLTVLRQLLDPLAGALGFANARGSIDSLIRACNRVAAEQIRDQQLPFARKTGWDGGQRFYAGLGRQVVDLPENECVLRLGWGTGFDDKTITDQLGEETFVEVLDGYRLGVGRPRRDLNRPPLRFPLAPKSRKVALDSKGRWVPLGWIKIAIEPG